MEAVRYPITSVNEPMVFRASRQWLLLLAFNLLAPTILVGLTSFKQLGPQAICLTIPAILFFSPVTLCLFLFRREAVVGDEGLMLRWPGGQQTAFYPWTSIADVRLEQSLRGWRSIRLFLTNGGQATILQHSVEDLAFLSAVIEQRRSGLR
ncbi:MAG: hypothetical protein U0232_08330 [Thermomicrobiales bacterium]